MKQDFPTFDIYSLTSNKLPKDSFVADYFKPYLKNNPHVKHIHKHSFFHLVFFTKGKGTHTLDFNKYPIHKGIIYFMRPNQLHSWDFEEDGEGYVINFTDAFFDFLHQDVSILHQFPFFNYLNAIQVFDLESTVQVRIKELFEQIINEIKGKAVFNILSIWSLLLQLFIDVSRTLTDKQNEALLTNNYNSVLAKRFLSLIETHFKTIKLPKDYASLLHISSAHLNTISKEQLRTTAGELIRNRILLEAKRLLVNRENTINAIALELNFLDTSYFVRFFKKYTGLTPDSFRKQY